MLMSEEEAAKYTEPVVETTPEPTETKLEPEVIEPAPVEKPKTNMIPAIARNTRTKMLTSLLMRRITNRYNP